MQIWPHSRMDLKKEIRIRGCIVLTHPLFVMVINEEIKPLQQREPPQQQLQQQPQLQPS